MLVGDNPRCEDEGRLLMIDVVVESACCEARKVANSKLRGMVAIAIDVGRRVFTALSATL